MRASTLLFDQPVDRFLSTLPSAGGAARMSATLPVRVMVQDAWDEVRLELPRATRWPRSSAGARGHPGDPAIPPAYVLKFRGAELQDESRSLADAGAVVPNGAAHRPSQRGGRPALPTHDARPALASAGS